MFLMMFMEVGVRSNSDGIKYLEYLGSTVQHSAGRNLYVLKGGSTRGYWF